MERIAAVCAILNELPGPTQGTLGETLARVCCLQRPQLVRRTADLDNFEAHYNMRWAPSKSMKSNSIVVWSYEQPD